MRPRKLDVVLDVYAGDMPLVKFCQLSPNSVTIEEETLREKVMIAIHAARAYEVRILPKKRIDVSAVDKKRKT